MSLDQTKQQVLSARSSGSETIRVVEVAEFGGPEVLATATAPVPLPGPGEVVIEVAAADVLALDTLIRSGRAASFFPVRPPYVPGNGGAGRVTSVGDGVDPGLLGQRVIARSGGAGGSGGYTERLTVDAGLVIPVPDEVDLLEAAAVLHDGATAHGLVERTGISASETVLILGAGGGMGVLLVQLAHAAGARVIAAARGRDKLALLSGLGADATVDYREPGWPECVIEAAGGAAPQVVFDGAGGHLGKEAFEITATGGRFSAHGAPGGAFAMIDPQEAKRRQVSVRGIEQVQFSDGEHARLAGRALAALAAGRIKPHIGQTFPLAQAAAAHRAIEARATVGKTLLTVG